MVQLWWTVSCCVLLGVAGQIAPPSAKELMPTLAKADSRVSVAEAVWQKRVSDVDSDPSRAESEVYQKRLDQASKELARAKLNAELASRHTKVATDVKGNIRRKVHEIEKTAKETVARINGEDTVMDERNQAMLERVKTLKQENHELDQDRKEHSLHTELKVRGALGGMASSLQREAKLQNQLEDTKASIKALQDKQADIDEELDEADQVHKALQDATAALKSAGDERTGLLANVKKASYTGDESGGGWYDVQDQGLCFDFCREVTGSWICALGGGGESTEGQYQQADFQQCEHQGAKPDTPKGKKLEELDSQITNATSQVAKLNGLAIAIDHGSLVEQDVTNKGEMAATKAHEHLLEHSLNSTEAAITRERELVTSKVSDQDRIDGLEEQVKELQARKVLQAQQIAALAETIRLVKLGDKATLLEKLNVNKQLDAAHLPGDKLPTN